MRSFTALSILFALSGPCFAQPSPDAGRATYSVCAGCHGFVAEGNALVNAPKLAGLEPWYLARQMRYFRTGIRGTAAEDIHGKRMATMALAANSDRALEDLVAYIGTLPATTSAATIDGDQEAGRQTYGVCAACHGEDGAGSEATSSPALAGLDDWYVLEQLRLYAEGIRGTHAGDTYGRQMQAFIPMFQDERTRRDLVAYINSLQP